MVDLQLPVAPKAQEPKTSRRRAPQAKTDKSADSVIDSGARDWKDVVGQIRALRNEGLTVPQIADKLELDYVLVNQVMVQSYKMTMQTVEHFERRERMRLGIEA
jgi:ribosome-binding protein aMBF1 (putative translation factor)